MTTFHYRAKTNDARTVMGQVTADKKDEAVDKIIAQGLTPILIEEGVMMQDKKVLVRAGKVSAKQVFMFSRQMVSLLRAGVPILRALDAISAQVRSAYLKHVLENIHSGIRGGRSFSDCLADYPRIFPGLYVTMVKAGEESGRLNESLSAVTEYLKTQGEISSKVRQAMAYPGIMLIFGVGTVFFILTHVMPQITDLFVHLDQQLPMLTLAVMAVSNFLVDWWLAVGIAACVLFVAAKNWTRTAIGKATMGRLGLKLPFFGSFWMRVDLARFCRTMELLLKSGVSIVRALQLSVPVVNNPILAEQLAKCQAELIAGRSFGEALRETPVVPPMLGHIITVGEESGSLSGTFEEIAETFEQETGEMIKIMTTLLEPFMIIVVGGVIGVIVVAMLLPIFQLDVFAS